MTPFGALLRSLRNERGIDLRTLANSLEVGEKVLSAAEIGRRRPLGSEHLEKLKKILRLDEEQFDLLSESARYSTARIRIPLTAKPAEYRLVHRVVEAIGEISDREIEAMQSILDRPKHGHTANHGGENAMT